MGNGPAKDPRRCPRFQVQGTTLLWPEDSGGVRTIRTRTANISRTGLLIEGDFNQRIGARVQFEVELPAPIGGNGCVLRGSARLVRFEEFAGKRIAFGAEIERYQITRRLEDESTTKVSGN